MADVYTKSAAIYDAEYSFKDYAAESEMLERTIREHKSSSGDRLLDVACGTGAHIGYLCGQFDCEGLDLDPAMLAIARERLPNVAFHQGDMTDFDLGRRFDVITCLFSSIGYVRTVERLNQAVARFAAHLVPGGVLILEPWITPDKFQDGHLGSLLVDREDFKLARIHKSRVEGRLSIMDLHFLVGTPEGVQFFTELHELGLFTDEEYRASFTAAGLDVTLDPEGPMGRGLYIGKAR